MATFDNTRPVNSPADDQLDVSEYLPNSEDILTSIPRTSTQGMITTPCVEDNTTSTSSRTEFLSTNAAVRGTRDTRPYINSFLRNEATKAAYVCLFNYAYDDETKWFDSLATLKRRPWLIEKGMFCSVVVYQDHCHHLRNMMFVLFVRS